MVNMGNVWDRTTEFLSDNSRALLPIVLVAMLIPQSISALVAAAGPVVAQPLVQGIGLVCTLIALWGQLAVIALALDPDGGRPGAAATATRNYPRAVAVMLVLLAAVVVLALPIVAILVANGVDLSAFGNGNMAAQANLSGAAGGFVLLYAIVLALVVLFVTIRTALLYPVVVAEGGTIGAIRRAFALSRGIVWKMIGVWLLFVIVYLVASLAITSALGAVIRLLSPNGGAFGPGSILIAILSGLVSTVFTMITAAFSAKLYRAVLTAREGAARAA